MNYEFDHDLFVHWSAYKLYSYRPRAQRLFTDAFTLINAGLMQEAAND